MSEYYTLIKVWNENDELIVDCFDPNNPSLYTICFNSYIRSQFKPGAKICLYILKNYLKAEEQYNAQRIKEYLTTTKLNARIIDPKWIYKFSENTRNVFPHEFEEHDDYFEIKIKYDDYSLGSLRAALDFFRILWETPLVNMYEEFCQSENAYNSNYTFLENLQQFFIKNKNLSSLSHSVPCNQYCRFYFAREKDVIRLRKEKNNIETGNSFWETCCE